MFVVQPASVFYAEARHVNVVFGRRGGCARRFSSSPNWGSPEAIANTDENLECYYEIVDARTGNPCRRDDLQAFERQRDARRQDSADRRQNSVLSGEGSSESHFRGMARGCTMSDAINRDLRLLAAIAYGEASTANDSDEIGGIAFSVANRCRAWRGKTASELRVVDPNYAFAWSGSNQRFNEIDVHSRRQA
jgi:hypothetical protein